LLGTFYDDIRIRKMTRIYEVNMSITKRKVTGILGKTYEEFNYKFKVK